MASERDAAKQAATELEARDPELEAAIASARLVNVDWLREEHRHTEQLARDERGALGVIFGGKDHAPQFMAFVATVLGFLIFAVVLVLIAKAGDATIRTFWWDVAQYVLTFTGTALGFAVGASSK